MTTNHNDDEIIITETPRVLEIRGSGCIIRTPDLSDIRYMANRLEIRDITLGTLGWIPEWILEVYMENCKLLPNTAEPCEKLNSVFTNLPQTVIQLTCRNCSIPNIVYQQLVHNRLIRLELINQGLTKLPGSINDFAPNLLFLNLNSNKLSEVSSWPQKIRGLKLSNNKLSDLAHLGQLPLYLEDLDLSFNNFSEIPTGQLSPHLRKLNMSRNELNWLPETQNEYPPNLRDLNISGNCGLDDLTDAVFPDMLTTLNAAECEISRLPHDLDCYCLSNMDVSDNNISSLDELPFDKVMNINYVGNPCWVPSVNSSPVPLDNVFKSVNTDFSDTDSIGYQGKCLGTDKDDRSKSALNVLPIFCPPLVGLEFSVDDANNNDVSELESGANSVFSSGCPTPVKTTQKTTQMVSMMDYKEAIKKSPSQEELEKINYTFQKQINNTNSLVYSANDPLIQAIDYVVASGVKRVGSFFNAMSDILTPGNDAIEYDDTQESVYSSPSQKFNNTSIAGKVLDELEYYGIFGSFE